MASEHRKITSYIPKDILEALDKWRGEQELDSRNAAIVAILADYLGVQYPVRLLDTAPLSIHLHTVLDELFRLSQRMDAMEDSIGAVPQEVQSTVPIAPPVPSSTVSVEVLSTALIERDLPTDEAQFSQRIDAMEDSIGTVPNYQPDASSTVSSKVLSTAPLEKGVTIGEAQHEALSTAPPLQPAPLTQMALAKRLGCSDKAIEKHRKQGSKENFAAWSRDRDPDSKAWTWEGSGGRGQPLRFMAVD